MSIKPTLLAAVKESPKLFEGIKFAISFEDTEEEVRTNALNQLQYPAEQPKKVDILSDWGLDEKEWPECFYSIHSGPKGGFYLQKRRFREFLEEVPDRTRNLVDAPVTDKINWSIKFGAFANVPPLASHAACEAELRKIFGNYRFKRMSKNKRPKGRLVDAEGLFKFCEKHTP